MSTEDAVWDMHELREIAVRLSTVPPRSSDGEGDGLNSTGSEIEGTEDED